MKWGVRNPLLFETSCLHVQFFNLFITKNQFQRSGTIKIERALPKTYFQGAPTRQGLCMAMLSIRISFPIFQMFILYTLNIRVRNWCVNWAYVSEPVAYTERTGTRQNWYIHSACASEIKWCLAPIKILKTSLYFNPEVGHPERLDGVNILKSEPSKISHLGTLKVPGPFLI